MSSVRSVCPYCGVGCGLVMEVADGRVTRVSGDKSHPANQGRLCTKGLTSAQALQDSGRMDAAYLRSDRGREPVRVDMDAAIAETARRLGAIRDAHGPDAIALYVSGQMSLEAQYLANKLAKGFIGTNQIESNSRLCMASAGSGYKLSLGSDGPPGSYDDFDQADLFFVSGANMADCHPILFLRMMDRVKAGARLIVVDPRRTTTADKAHLYLQIRPGTDLALLNGLLHLLHAHGHTNADFIARHTEGWDDMPGFLADYTPARVSAVTGLAEADIRQAAQWIGEARRWMSCWTMGLNQSTHGTWHTNAICNLHLATGAICEPGSGPFSLTGQPNAMGGREMGYMGPGLPGQRSTLVERDRDFVEDTWGVPRGTLHTRLVGGTVAMFERMAAGDIKACWIICTNPVASVPNRQSVIDGLQKAELVITQDAFLDTETNRCADILLPGALWAEADGVMINSERNLTLMQQAVPPPGQALADWQIIARVACAMGHAQAFSYQSADEVFDELRRFWNPDTGYDIRGASHARLRHAPLQWPSPPNDREHRHPIRYLNDGVSQTLRRDAAGETPRIAFATPTGKGVFFARPYTEPTDRPDEAFPMVLNTGRLQHQWHTMTKTGKIPTLVKLNPRPFIEIHPEDASALGIGEEDSVEILSRRGRAVLPAALTHRVRAGNCFAPIHWNDVYGEHLAINAVTSDAVDPVSQQPELKFSAVVLRRLAPAARAQVDAATEDTGPQHAVQLLWASQTGNVEGFAAHCARQLQRLGVPVALRNMNDTRVGDLPRDATLLLLTSTFGDGEPPDNGTTFWRAVQSEEAVPHLKSVRFAVLAFGDSSYDQFCGFGRQLDARLHDIGAQRLLPRVDCEPEYQVPAQAWLTSVCRALATQVATPELALALANAGDPTAATDETPMASTGSEGVSRQHPWRAALLANRLLNGPGATKETRQFVFDLQGSGLHYRAGDAVGVWPTNCPERVADMLLALKLPASAPVSIQGQDMPISEALLQHLDIARITTELLGFIQQHTGSRFLADLLEPGHAQELRGWLWGRQIVDVLQAFPIRVAAQAWVGVLKRLQPRLYSIASSPLAQLDELHITVSTVRYRHEGKARGGVCSTFLADRAGEHGAPIFVQPSAHFHPPQNADTPLIMVGPGTGVAPFRGFLHERQARGDRGRNWLFFGEQHAATDYYYRDELAAFQSAGYLHRLDTAFSRDQADKVYVQDRMLEHGAELWAWLQDGAHFCVCGDASRMAKDVDAALRTIAQQHGGLSADAAADHVASLARDRRYLRDVY